MHGMKANGRKSRPSAPGDSRPPDSLDALCRHVMMIGRMEKADLTQMRGGDGRFGTLNVDNLMTNRKVAIRTE